CRVNVGMVTHIHHQAMKSVSAHSGEQRIEGGATGLLRAGAEQCIANEQQVRLEGGGVRICGGLATRTSRIARCDETTCRLEPLLHETELESEQLLGVAPAILLPDGRQQLAIFRE